MIAAVCGVVTAATVAWFVPWQLTLLVTWIVTALAVIFLVWEEIYGVDAARTKERATRADFPGWPTDLLLVCAGLASLVGVGVAFWKAKEVGGDEEAILEGIGVLTLVVSWVLVHTLFTLRYAHLYYMPAEGGINFKQDVDPDYHDFAYLAFTIGMTYQVSDNDVTDRKIRPTVLRHALISFVFGAVILAATVNVIAGLLND